MCDHASSDTLPLPSAALGSEHKAAGNSPETSSFSSSSSSSSSASSSSSSSSSSAAPPSSASAGAAAAAAASAEQPASLPDHGGARGEHWEILYHGLPVFKGKGRGEPLRLLLEDSGVAYSETNDGLYGPTGITDAFRRSPEAIALRTQEMPRP